MTTSNGLLQGCLVIIVASLLGPSLAASQIPANTPLASRIVIARSDSGRLTCVLTQYLVDTLKRRLPRQRSVIASQADLDTTLRSGNYYPKPCEAVDNLADLKALANLLRADVVISISASQRLESISIRALATTFPFRDSIIHSWQGSSPAGLAAGDLAEVLMLTGLFQFRPR